MLKNNKNASDSLVASCYVCALGAFGAFFRWLQMQVARDSETGLINPSILNIILPLIIVAAVVVLWLHTKAMDKDGKVYPTGMSEALRGISIVYIIAAYIIAAVTVIGGIMTIINSSLDAQRGLYALLAALAILSGLSFPLVCNASRKHYSPGLVSIFMAIPVIMYCVWLIVCYRANANNPNLWSYAIEILAVCSSIIAFMRTAGYAFGKSAPRRACYMCQLAAFMCITTLADSRYMGLELILVGTAGMLLIEGWLIIKNRCLPEELPKPKPVKKPSAETEQETDVVIEAGSTEDNPEPTLQAPTRRPKESAKPSDAIDEIINEYKE